MKQTKKLLFVLFALALVLSLGVCAAAEGGDAPDVVVSGTLELGDAQYTFYSDGNLVLEGNGPVYGVYMDEPMEPYFNDIKTLTVGEGITSLNGLVFTNCKNLETVKLPKSFHITEDNFINCPHLKQFIVNPDNPTHAVDAVGALYKKDMTVLYKYVTGSSATVYTVANETEVIWEYAFSNCAALEKVVLPDSVTTIQDEAFIHCLALREINLPNSLTSLGGNAFFNCRSLQQITLPDQLTRIRAYTFMQCVEMTSVSIPASLREIDGGAFQSCEALTDVYIMMDENTWNNEVTVGGQNDYLLAATPHFLAPSILESGNCGADGSDVQYQLYSDGTLVISGAGKIQCSFFSGRSDILKVTIENGITGAGYYAFNHCDNLESVSLPKTFQMSNGDSFFCCMNLKHIYVDAQNEYMTVDAFGVVYNKDKTTLIKLPTGSELTEYTVPDGVEVIAPEAFYVCKMLKKLVIPDSVKTIHVQAFCEDYALESLRLPSHLSYLGERAFGLCSSLRQVTIPNGVSEIGYEMFVGCKSLTSVVIPDTVTKIGRGAFSNCEALSDVYVMMDEATWNRDVTVAEKNDCLLNANLHFLPADSDWIRLPYTTDGLSAGDWYLDMDAFVDAIGRGKSDEEKAEVRALIEQHVVFSYNPGGEQYVYKYEFTDLPAQDGTPVSGTVILPLDLTLGSEDAFPYDYNALQQCVRQYHTPTAPDTPQQPADDDDDSGNWFDQHIIRPLRSAIATILSFFRRLFGKKR